jgi:hypothetical protein
LLSLPFPHSSALTLHNHTRLIKRPHTHRRFEATAKPLVTGPAHSVSTSTRISPNLVEAAAATACCASVT